MKVGFSCATLLLFLFFTYSLAEVSSAAIQKPVVEGLQAFKIVSINGLLQVE